jgi:hypothetical protein
MLDLAQPELDVDDTEPGAAGARRLDQGGRHVHSDDVA